MQPDSRLQTLLKHREAHREDPRAKQTDQSYVLHDVISDDPEWIENYIKEMFSLPARAPSEITLVTVHQLDSEPYAHTELKRLGDCMNVVENTARLTRYISAQQSSSDLPLVWVSAQINCPTSVVLDKSYVTISTIPPANGQTKVTIHVSWSLDGPATTPIFS